MNGKASEGDTSLLLRDMLERKSNAKPLSSVSAQVRIHQGRKADLEGI